MRVKHSFSFQTEYELNGRKLQEVAEERDLGIFVTDDLKPSVQCAKATARAMQVLGVSRETLC